MTDLKGRAMKEIKLVEPQLIHELAAKEFVAEFKAHSSSTHGFAGLHKYDDYSAWLTAVECGRDPKTVPPDRIPAESLFVFKEEELIGIVWLRYQLNADLLRFGGHIGLSIRPSARNEGYGTRALALALERCFELGIDEVLVTCNQDNIASAKMITNNGGVFFDQQCEDDGTIVERYWFFR